MHVKAQQSQYKSVDATSVVSLRSVGLILVLDAYNLWLDVAPMTLQVTMLWPILGKD